MFSLTIWNIPEKTCSYYWKNLFYNHLGRYGIVRNNYYQITINDITQPGEPITDPTVEPSTDKDDETNYWINVSIKVLSWKIRTQDVIL